MRKQIPVPSKKFPRLGNITTPWGGKTTQEAWHPGVDIGLEKGTPIKVPVDGVVTGVDTGHVQGENNFGNSVNVKAKNGDTFQFHHLDKVLVGLGQKVKKGQKIMTGGDSGATYSPTGRDPSNLDMRIVNAYNKYKNPTKYIRSL